MCQLGKVIFRPSRTCVMLYDRQLDSDSELVLISLAFLPDTSQLRCSAADYATVTLR